MNKEAVTLQEMENALLNKFMEKYDNPQKTLKKLKKAGIKIPKDLTP